MPTKNQRTGAPIKRGPRRNRFPEEQLEQETDDTIVEPTVVEEVPVEPVIEQVVSADPEPECQPDEDNLPNWVEPPQPDLPDWVQLEPEEPTPLPNAKGIEPLVQVKDLNPLPARKPKPKK